MNVRDYKTASEPLADRLPRYYRHLGELVERGVERVSSSELSVKMHSTASQVRQDLNVFGCFGYQGYGYNVKDLYHEIQWILGIEKQNDMVIVGAGNLGQALCRYTGFEKYGFAVKGMFDVNPILVGMSVCGIEIQEIGFLESFVSRNAIRIAALTLPESRVPAVVEQLVRAGIKGIWNFVHTDLNLPDHIAVENVHLSESLMLLSYYIHNKPPYTQRGTRH